MKKFSAFIIALMLLTSNVSAALADTAEPRIIADGAAAGIVTVTYPVQEDIRIKVLVEKDGVKYYYNMIDSDETLPLQMGDGDYKITIYENITGSRYRAVLSDTVSVDLAEDKDVYLQSVQSIEWNDSMKAILKAQALTRGLKTDAEKVSAIHQYIVDNYSYDFAKISTMTSAYLPDVERNFASRKGICYDFASLFAAMTRSVGIPAKLIKGYTPNAKGYHAWNEVYINDQWVTLDATYDAQMDDLGGKYTMIKDSDLYDKVYEY